MKTLYLIRHAKSSWKDASLKDFDRPLNKRGRHDAPEMGKRLKSRQVVPHKVICSPARRAADTATALLQAMEQPASAITFVPGLYHASAEQLLREVARTEPGVRVLFLCGHNPGLTDFASQICQTPIENIVTAGVFVVQFDVQRWDELTPRQPGTLLWYDFPKNKAAKNS